MVSLSSVLLHTIALANELHLQGTATSSVHINAQHQQAELGLHISKDLAMLSELHRAGELDDEVRRPLPPSTSSVHER